MTALTQMNYFAPLLLALSSVSYGAGFQLQERSTSGQGRAFAGESAVAEDASAIVSNPASMLLLEGTQISSGITYVAPDVEVSGSTTSPVPLGSGPTKDSKVAVAAAIPYFHLSHKLDENLAIGASLHSRFGLSTDYSKNFLGSNIADKSEIRTFYLSPKAAYRMNSKLSLGAGFDVIYTDGELSNSFTSAQGGAEITNVSGDDLAYGFNLGALYQINDKTRVGLSYYSKVDLKLEGEITTESGVTGLLAPNSKVDGQVKSELPSSIDLSIYHEVSPQWALHSNVTWTDWSAFKELTVETNNGNLPTVVENWKNTVRLAIGTTYKHNNKWTFRAGAAFDESPVRSSEFRTLRIPDSDRFWFSTGATYTINENYSLDLAYTHILAKTVDITDSSPVASFEGKASGHVNLFAFSVNGKF